MSTVPQTKPAVTMPPPRKKLALAHWLQPRVDDPLSDDEMLGIIDKGARAAYRRIGIQDAGGLRRPMSPAP